MGHSFIFIHLKANQQFTNAKEKSVIGGKNDGTWSDIFTSEMKDFSPNEPIVSEWKPLVLSDGKFLAKAYYGPVTRANSEINYTAAVDICAGYEALL